MPITYKTKITHNHINACDLKYAAKSHPAIQPPMRKTANATTSSIRLVMISALFLLFNITKYLFRHSYQVLRNYR